MIKKDILKVEPPFYYQYVARAKRRLRDSREKMYREMKRRCDIPLIKRWNDDYVEKLSKLLREIILQKSFLSTDAIRNEKIEKLHDVLEGLRCDYKEGRLFGRER